MINWLTLKNFRKVLDSTIDFTAGVNVIRGNSEAGKSTRLEALGYALFGAKALKTSLAETVTWGAKESSLQVEAGLTIDGQGYAFSRSKSGAEVRYGDQLITGQNEVSEFAAQLLGADRDTAAKLMFASQGDLRGSLTQGPKATAELIESLANFDLFDLLIDKMGEKLSLGTTKPLEERIVETETQIENFDISALPDSAAALTLAAEEQSKADALKLEIEGREAIARQARLAADNEASNDRVRRTLEGNLLKAQETLAVHVSQRDAAAIAARVEVDTARIEMVTRDINDASVAKLERKKFERVQALVHPETDWCGDEASLLAEIAATDAKCNRHAGRVSEIVGEVKALQGLLVTDSTCRACGQKILNQEDALKHSAEAQAKIEVLQAEKVTESAAAMAASFDLADLKTVVKQAVPFNQVASELADLVDVDRGSVPPQITWRGVEPTADMADEASLRRELQALNDAVTKKQNSAARVVALDGSIVEDVEQVARLTAQVAELPAQSDSETLQRTAREADTALSSARVWIREHEAGATKHRNEAASIERQREDALKGRDALKVKLTTLKGEFDTLNFNNALLKKVKTARPIVADKLWAVVLHAVSTMFSQMRGEQSVVTKTGAGFLVNGQAVASLSGSTLDLLGLAIRVALVKTFVPQASFTTLDEPSAACDADRTADLMGFVAAAGFQQVLVVTHEDQTEAIADNLIYLE